MNYFDTLNSPKDAELAYAKWYENLPTERKAKMMCDFYQFGFESIKYNYLKIQPYACHEEIKLEFVRATQKEAYSEEVFAFIEKTFQERAEKEWQERFKKMKKDLEWSYEDMANFMGASNGPSVKASINRRLPAFAKLAVCIFEKLNK